MQETKLKEMEMDIAKKTQSIANLKRQLQEATEREHNADKNLQELKEQVSKILPGNSENRMLSLCLCNVCSGRILVFSLILSFTGFFFSHSCYIYTFEPINEVYHILSVYILDLQSKENS